LASSYFVISGLSSGNACCSLGDSVGRQRSITMAKRTFPIVAVALGMILAHSATALTVGQADTFSSLTLENWFAGGGPLGQFPPVPPEVIATGGPAGAGDAFMQVTATGGAGPGSHLSVINAAQWAGDYTDIGVAAISMDLRNLGNADLTVRLLFEDPMGGPPLDEGVTTFGAILPAGGGWMPVSFAINPGALTMLDGNASTLLHQTTFLRIIHSPTASDAATITGVLGVDNITAVGVARPEPSALALLAAALVALTGARRHVALHLRERGP
jgi:hypothetical protein